jgi:hypothetical protein
MIASVSIPAGAAAETPKPVWTIRAESTPTVLRPSLPVEALGFESPPTIHVRVENRGAATTSGPYVLTDELPEGISVRPEPIEFLWLERSRDVFAEEGGRVPAVKCEGVGRLVTCTSQAGVFGESVWSVGPGEGFSLWIPVETSANLAAGGLINTVSISGGGSSTATASAEVPSDGRVPAFDFLPGGSGLLVSASTAEGSGLSLAGAHPYEMSFEMTFPTVLQEGASGASVGAAGSGVKRIAATLPRGMVVNPGAVPVLCAEPQLESGGCPPASQVGTITITGAPSKIVSAETFPLYEIVSPGGVAAELGFEVQSVINHITGSVNSEGAFELVASASDLLNKLPVAGASITLWGEPLVPSHDLVRGPCLKQSHEILACPTELESKPYLSMPSHCSAGGNGDVSASSWLEPAVQVSRDYQITDLEGHPLPLADCGSLKFEPSISAKPTNPVTDSPTGLSVTVHQRQNEEPGGRATANLKDARVALPVGLSVNPSGGNGLDVCTESQIGRTTLSPLRFSEVPQACPNASKVGTVKVGTPLVDHELSGGIYVAKPFDNPFHSLLAIYLAIEDERTGVISKLAGKVETDATTGQLTTTFEENPELPLEDINLSLFSGNRAALKTGLTCGSFQTSAQLTPWSAPQAPDAIVTDSFAVSEPAAIGPCPATEAQAPGTARLVAGTVTPTAGSYSPLVFSVSREDGTQQMSAVESVLPPGLVGKLAGIPYCSPADIAKASSRSAPNDGAVELASPSCPTASEVGTVTVSAGAGGNPVSVDGDAYLAGPYKGAPLSLVVITPAIAGPFDLGVTTVRVALYVDPFTAQIRAVSDPLPRILQGIPLDVRSVSIRMDRPQFTLNPTSCDPMSIGGSLSTFSGGAVPLSQRFQVGGCDQLKFKPTLKLSLNGATKRGGHPALKAVVTYPQQGAYANIASAQVNLPHSEFLDQGNLNKVCKQAELRAGVCPATSIYGHVKAWTPLLDKPLEGPVYLGVGFGYKLPALVAELNGQIQVLLVGKVDSGPNKGLRNTFEAVPDAPVSRFVLTLKGGKKYGLLENSENICRKKLFVTAQFAAQNGQSANLRPRLNAKCRGGKARSGHRKKPSASHTKN